jgi:sialate O-acetylesterase
MKFHTCLCHLSLIVALLGAVGSHATEYVWNNRTGNNNYQDSSNWDTPLVSATATYAAIDLTGPDKSVFSTGSSLNIAGLHIGFNDGDGEFEQTGGTLTATKNSGAASRVGNGYTGTWTMTGGTANINAIQLGLNSGSGNLVISNGTMVVARGVSNYSLQIGVSGVGKVDVYGGSLATRTGLFLGDDCTFAVYGSAASSIGIGSQGTVDGRWVQEAGTLKVRMDSGGVTPIYVAAVGTGDWLGNVTFYEGALLDVGFLGDAQEGEWDVMSWDGTLTDYGLALAPTVDPTQWGFRFVDTDASGSPDTLRVMTGAPYTETAYALDATNYNSRISSDDVINDGEKTFLSETAMPVPEAGAAGFNDGSVGAATFGALQFPATNTFVLDTLINTNGYTITNITTIAGAPEGGANLANQKYEVWISTVGDDGFALLEAVDYIPFTSTNLNGNTGSTKVTLGNSTGTLADRVDQVRFIFLDDGQSFGSADGTVYQEIDIYTSTVTPPQLFVDTMFQSKMVLQRDMNVPMWGTAPAGTVVTLKLDGDVVAMPTTDSSGTWTARIGAYPGDGGVSHTLTISMPDEEDIVLSNVVFGDVYICSGQSNMARTLAGIGATAEIAVADYPLIRQLTIDLDTASSEQDDPPVLYNWMECSSAVAVNFCAVGYYFAKEVQATTGEPVGLLFSSWGGQPIQRFVNPEGMAAVPALAGLLQNIENGKVGSYYDIYNAMIAPMAPYGVRGALWYQGENDASAGDGDIYQLKMRALIRGWREKWAQDEFSFYYVQLCNYTTTLDWPIIRAAQLRTLSEPDTGMAVIIDVGNDSNIHPTNKQDVGNRLASWALAKELGYEINYSSPLPYSTQIEGDQIRVLFDHADGGLMVGTKNGEDPVVETTGALQNFEIAGSNQVFVSATAVIDADTVLVSSASIAEPLYVRYCYVNAPTGGNKLYNRAGFPASPFRTDSGYELEVYVGSGDSTELVEGSTVAISADAAASGFVFDRWIGAASAISNANAASTTVTMPDHDLYLLASYRADADSSYVISINNGSGSGTSQANSIINIEAQTAPDGEMFVQWAGDTQTVENVYAPATTFRMPASNVTLTAVYTTVDRVGDGISDTWRAAYFGGDGSETNATSAAWADPDEDGLSNLHEFGAGSNPTNSGSRFEIRAFEVSSANVTVGFESFEDHHYILESSSCLTSGVWQTELYHVTGDGQLKTLHPQSGTATNRFFQLRSTSVTHTLPEGL